MTTLSRVNLPLPIPGGDLGNWADKLNAILTVVDDLLPVTPEMFGAVGDGTTNDTTALQAWLDYGVTNHVECFLPYRPYLYSTLVFNGPLSIRGTGWKAPMDANYAFGNSGWALGNLGGSVLVSSATSGTTITWASSAVGAVNIKGILFRGPGSGTAIGMQYGASVGVINGGWDNVGFVNWPTGLIFHNAQNNDVRGLHFSGCLAAFAMENASNANHISNLTIGGCGDASHPAMNMRGGSELNDFDSGVLQGCCGSGGAVLRVDDSGGNDFDNFYFENPGCTWALDCDSPGAGDYNTVNKPHFGTTSDKLRFYSNWNALLFPSAFNGATIVGDGNTLLGRFPATITFAGVDRASKNLIFDLEAGVADFRSIALRLSSGTPIYIEDVGTTSKLARDAATGDTLVGAGSGVVRANAMQLGGAGVLYAGAGMPSNSIGANGDYFFRKDGVAGSSDKPLYHKESGVWVAM